MDRRTFLQLLSSSAVAASFPASIARALTIPAHNATGTIQDVEHIVFLMQENRSFDHYFGTLQGVRGYGDPRAVTLTTGNSVFCQPNSTGGYVMPFHPTAEDLGLQFLQDLAHDWTSTHLAWNGGRHDQWVPNKGPVTMAHLSRQDIPYHYALADAFTVCDAYHSSLLGPTDPNRYHMFTGWTGNDGQYGGPAIDNSLDGFSWPTFPEVLEDAGITWKVYHDIGMGMNAAGNWGETEDPYIGNYGDNSLVNFQQFQNAVPGTPLYDNAMTGTNVAVSGTLFDIFRSDVLNDTLPQVSWVVAPEAYCEHPNWPANYGAWYVSEILNSLTANPAVWSKTVFIIMYDENDGFFDHAVPPTPPQTEAQGRSTVASTNEIFAGTPAHPSGPYGLGARVPMLVLSPWSKGGWVNSQVFDHTSLIRFVQARFGTASAPLAMPAITPWRYAVCGDLTSAFNFATPNNAVVQLPDTSSYLAADDQRHASYCPEPPLIQALPQQEPGTRRARALPYVLNAEAAVTATTRQVSIKFENMGEQAAVFHVRSADSSKAPRSYTISPRTTLSDTWRYGESGLESYELSVYGPNGFLRCFKGGFSSTSASLQTSLEYDVATEGVMLTAVNTGKVLTTFQLSDQYADITLDLGLRPGETYMNFFYRGSSSGWYDFILSVESDHTFRQQFAGHIETGKDSITDPAIGGVVPAPESPAAVATPFSPAKGIPKVKPAGKTGRFLNEERRAYLRRP